MTVGMCVAWNTTGSRSEGMPKPELEN